MKKGDKFAIGEGVTFVVKKENKTSIDGEKFKAGKSLGNASILKAVFNLIGLKFLQ